MFDVICMSINIDHIIIKHQQLLYKTQVYNYLKKGSDYLDRKLEYNVYKKASDGEYLNAFLDEIHDYIEVRGGLDFRP